MANGANGDDVTIKIGANLVGGQRNATFSAEMPTISTAAKGDSANTFIPGRPTYTIDLDGLYIVGDTAYDALSDAMEAQTTVTVNRFASGSWVASATAFVTSLSLGHPDQEASTAAISLQVTGVWSTGL